MRTLLEGYSYSCENNLKVLFFNGKENDEKFRHNINCV